MIGSVRKSTKKITPCQKPVFPPVLGALLASFPTKMPLNI